MSLLFLLFLFSSTIPIFPLFYFPLFTGSEREGSSRDCRLFICCFSARHPTKENERSKRWHTLDETLSIHLQSFLLLSSTYSLLSPPTLPNLTFSIYIYSFAPFSHFTSYPTYSNISSLTLYCIHFTLLHFISLHFFDRNPASYSHPCGGTHQTRWP